MNHQHIDEEELNRQIAQAINNGGYLKPLEINQDWVSYRHPGFPLDSASERAQRFNKDGEAAFYIASGDYCGTFEVPNYYDRIRCQISPTTINVFDLASFAVDFGYGDAFMQPKEGGGYDICQKVSSLLTDNHSVSGLLYQSAQCHAHGCTGYCLAILPGEEQSLPDSFFRRADEGSS